MKTQERKGFLILCLAAFFFSLFALSGKAVSEEISTPQMIVVRSIIMLPVLCAWAIQRGSPLVGKRKLLLFMRGFLGSIALFAFFHALKNLPLADTILIFQFHPILVACLAPLFLKERNRAVHWVLLSISFCGVALVVGPTGEGTWEGRLAAALCCLLASVVYILVRSLKRTEATLSIAISFPAVSLLLFGPAFLLRIPGCEWVQPSFKDWLFLAAMALAAVGGQVLLTLGLGKVPAARGTAPSNLGVAFALIYGMAFFDEIPGWITLAGAVIIVCAQLLLVATRCERMDRTPNV